MVPRSSTKVNEQRPLAWLYLWLAWILMHMLGAVAGSLVALPLALGSFGLGSGVVGFTAGSAIGLCQLRVLRIQLPPHLLSKFRHTWVLASALGGGIGFVVYFAIGTVAINAAFALPGHLSDAAELALHVASAMIGVGLFAGAQWHVLRRYVSGANWWIPIHLVGALLGAYVALTALDPLYDKLVPRGGWSFALVFFNHTQLIVGLSAIGVITGPVLIGLLYFASTARRDE